MRIAAVQESPRVAGCISLLLWTLASATSSAGPSSFSTLEIRPEHGVHPASISAMRLTGDERRLVTAGADGTVRTWALREQKLLQTLELPWTDGVPPTATALTMNGAADLFIVATAGSRRGAALLAIEPAEGHIRWRVNTPSAVGFLAMKSDGKSFLTLEQGGPRARSVQDGRQLAAIGDCPDSTAADLSKNEQLAVACGDGTLRLYRSDLAAPLLRLARRVPIHSLQFSPDAKWLAVGYRDTPHVEVIPVEDDAARTAILPDTTGISGDVRLVAWSRSGDVLMATGTWREKEQTMLRRWSARGAGAFTDVALPGGQKSATQIIYLPRAAIGILPSPKTSVLRDFSVTSAWPPDSLLVATSEPALWQVPPGGDVNPWPLRHRERPAALPLFVDSSGGWIEVPLASGHELQFSLIGRSLRSVSKEQSTPRPARSLPQWFELLPGRDAIRASGKTLPLLGAPILQIAGSPDGRKVALATADELLLVGADGTLRRGAALPAASCALGFSEDGRLVVTTLADATVRWFGATDGKPRLSLTWGRDATEWAAWTASGYYDASPRGGELLTALLPKQDNLPTSFRLDRMRQIMNRPDIVGRVLFTADEQQAVEQANAARGSRPPSLAVALPPTLRVISPKSEVDNRETLLPLRVRVSSPSGLPIDTLRVSVLCQGGRTRRSVIGLPTGRLVPGEEREHQVSVEVFPDNCTVYLQALTAYAESEPTMLQLHWQGPKVSPELFKPNLYLLAVGVSRTRNVLYKLGYPAKDARDISETFARQEGRRYLHVIRRTLTDEEATLAGIRDALAWLQTSPSSTDVVVIFMAGHGKSDIQAGSYYFYPHDASDSNPETTRLSSLELRSAVNQMPGSVVLFLDTCQAGGALDRHSGALGADLQRLAAEVATTESNIVVFTASTGAQSASERKAWGNGAFTKALVEGLRGKADQGGSGLVTISQLESYVSTRVRELTDDAQLPTTTKPQSTVDFALSTVGKPLYRRWWFWGGLGLVAATTVTGILLATRPWEPRVPEISF